MYMYTMERDLQRPAKTERGQRDVDFPELLQEGTYFPVAVVVGRVVINGRHGDDDEFIQVAEFRMSIHIILLPCVSTLYIHRLTSCQRANTSALSMHCYFCSKIHVFTLQLYAQCGKNNGLKNCSSGEIL